MNDRVERAAEAVFRRFRVEAADPPSVSWEQHAVHAVEHQAYLDLVRVVLIAMDCVVLEQPK